MFLRAPLRLSMGLTIALQTGIYIKADFVHYTVREAAGIWQLAYLSLGNI